MHWSRTSNLAGQSAETMRGKATRRPSTSAVVRMPAFELASLASAVSLLRPRVQSPAAVPELELDLARVRVQETLQARRTAVDDLKAVCRPKMVDQDLPALQRAISAAAGAGVAQSAYRLDSGTLGKDFMISCTAWMRSVESTRNAAELQLNIGLEAQPRDLDAQALRVKGIESPGGSLTP
eukprot:7390359-Prymnesium_polylepis.3